MTGTIEPSDGRSISYDLVRQAIELNNGGRHYTMSLTSDDEKAAIVAAVNVGIDSHLEACFVPDRGDSYIAGDRSITASEDTKFWKKGQKLTLARTLECKVSPESLPVLIRRLFELDGDLWEPGYQLADAILDTLGIDDVGKLHKNED